MQGGAPMVAQSIAGLERSISDHTGTGSDHNNRQLKKGWGAVCNGITIQGLWNHQERLDHINVLELRAAMFAIKAFTKDKATYPCPT